MEARTDRVKRLALLCVAALCAVLVPLYDAAAQTQTRPAAPLAPAPARAKSVFAHLPPSADVIPQPGETMKLEVSLVGTRDSERRLRGYIVRDGQLAEIVLPEAKYDLNDRPMYTFEIYAPLAELSYQFGLENSDGSFAYSERYLVRRRCWPHIELATTDLDPSLQDLDRLKELYAKSMVLDWNNKAYDTVLKLLDELQQELVRNE